MLDYIFNFYKNCHKVAILQMFLTARSPYVQTEQHSLYIDINRWSIYSKSHQCHNCPHNPNQTKYSPVCRLWKTKHTKFRYKAGIAAAVSLPDSKEI